MLRRRISAAVQPPDRYRLSVVVRCADAVQVVGLVASTSQDLADAVAREPAPGHEACLPCAVCGVGRRPAELDGPDTAGALDLSGRKRGSGVVVHRSPETTQLLLDAAAAESGRAQVDTAFDETNVAEMAGRLELVQQRLDGDEVDRWPPFSSLGAIR